jgi:enamine deaminase RidA (YjgF/YER057c/UK114 family)
MKTNYGIAAIAVGALLTTQGLHAADIVHSYKGDFPIASVVSVPAGATTYYLSGMTAPKAEGDTKAQTVGALTVIKSVLAEQNLTMGDVVMMHVYLVGDPAKDGKMDFAGMMEGYTQFFGTKDQPNKPSRTTVQVSSLVGPGQLVEIEVVAAHR